MKKKRILYIITKSNWGGAQRYVFELAHEAKRMGHEVAVACGGNGFLVERLIQDDIRVFPIHNFAREVNLIREVRAARELAVVLRTFQPDIVHVNSSKAGGTGALLARLTRVPHIVFTAHGWPFFEQRSLLSRTLMWFFSYLTVLFSHHTIVVSDHDKRHARMWGQQNKIVCIPLGIPPIDFESRDDARHTLFDETTRDTHKNALWLVSTGEFTHNKNISFLIEAIAALDPDLRKRIFVSLIGEGELKEQLKEQVSRCGLDGSVRFLGFVPEVRLFLKAFDIFLIPSLKEGLPYGLLEAGSAGLACIGSNVGGIPEVIEHEKSGILVDPLDVHSLTIALSILIHDEKKRRSCGDMISKHVSTHFSFDQMLKETNSLYIENFQI